MKEDKMQDRGDTVKEDKTNVCLPFPGFYNSALSGDIYNELSEIAKEHGFEDGDLPGKFYDYRGICLNVTRQWVSAFNALVTKITGIPVDFEFEAMTSPKYYNYETDRVFADVELSTLLKLYNWLDKSLLSGMSKRMFTSYDGFCSFYNPDWETWDEPETWDHNQWLCVLRAIVETKDEWQLSIYYDLETYTAVSEHVDWQKLEAEHPRKTEDE